MTPEVDLKNLHTY